MRTRNKFILHKTLTTNKCTKSVFISCNTLLHVSTLLGPLQGELSVVVTLRLHFSQLSENVLLTVYYVVFGGVNSLRSRLALHIMCRPQSPRLQKQRSTQSTAHSRSTVKNATLV
jgi:hypothetical protein